MAHQYFVTSKTTNDFYKRVAITDPQNNLKMISNIQPVSKRQRWTNMADESIRLAIGSVAMRRTFLTVPNWERLD